MRDEALKSVIKALMAGRAAIFPTDTVYGLGVAVCFASTPQELFNLKHRAAHKPIAWLVGSVNDLDYYGTGVSSQVRTLAEAAWPGALTFIVKASAKVPLAFQSAQGTIGMRMPAHETTLALIQQVGPLATTSANLSGQSVAQSYAQLAPELLAAVPSIEDAFQGSGISSTVIDCSQKEISIVRQGGAHVESDFFHSS